MVFQHFDCLFFGDSKKTLKLLLPKSSLTHQTSSEKILVLWSAFWCVKVPKIWLQKEIWYFCPRKKIWCDDLLFGVWTYFSHLVNNDFYQTVDKLKPVVPITFEPEFIQLLQSLKNWIFLVAISFHLFHSSKFKN